MIKKLKKYIAIMFISYKNYTVFLVDIIWKNIIYVLRVLIILTLYKAIYKFWWSSFTNYTLAQVSWWLIFVQAIVTAKPSISNEIWEEVKTWRISNYLLNPISYIYYKFVVNITQFSYNIIINLSIWFILGFIYLWWINTSLYWILWGFVLVIWAMLLQYFTNFCIWISAFYIEDNEWIRMIYNFFDRLFWWNILPIPFFPLFIQNIIYLSPFAYTWYTAWLIFAKFEINTFIFYFLVQIIWIIIFIIIAHLIYTHAKKYLVINWW